MSTFAIPPALPSPLRRLWAANWPLTLLGLAAVALAVVTVGLAVVDPRQITGAPAWAKPIKFAISTVFYSLTLMWMLSHVAGRRRLVALASGVTAVGLAIELVLIVGQVARGVRSHFNMSTPLDGAIFSVMGLTIMVVWLMNLLAAILVLRQKFTDRAFGWSLRLGLFVTLYGAGVAFLMTAPTSAQMAALQGGAAPEFVGAHSVGVADGGAGLPFLGWSTEGGDLRVPHFVGLHALQAVPFLGLVVNRAFASLNERRRVGLVWLGGAGYFGLALLLTWQALRGQPVVAPDALTLGALAALAAGVLVAGAGIVRARRKA